MSEPRDRQRLRAFYVQAWRKRREGAALEPLEQAVAAVVEQHPEYHALLGEEAALERDFSLEDGRTNPFLHMGMHVAIHEQVQSDRPPGIRDLYRTLLQRLGNAHTLEHAIMECLGTSLWEAQRAGTAADEQAYLECVRRLRPGSGSP